jgi:hypothetical protein
MSRCRLFLSDRPPPFGAGAEGEEMTQMGAPTIGQLLVGAFALSRDRNQPIYKRWIAASWRVGSKIPDSMVMASIQRAGEVDLICRALEEELLEKPSAEGEMDFRDNYLMMFAELGPDMTSVVACFDNTRWTTDRRSSTVARSTGCLLSGVKRKSASASSTSGFDPKAKRRVTR